MSTESACHWLPCSIDYDGRAPVSQYFRPEPLVPSKSDHAQAVTFRGRGLLARKIQKLPKGIHGNVFVQSSQDGHVLVSSTNSEFQHVYEWEHEWSENRLLRHTDTLTPVEDIHSQSSVQKSIALMDLMRKVHEPIPLEE